MLCRFVVIIIVVVVVIVVFNELKFFTTLQRGAQTNNEHNALNTREINVVFVFMPVICFVACA